MKKFRIRILMVLVAGLPSVILSSCSLFGLDFQQKYDRDDEILYNNQLNMSAWEYIKSEEGTYREFIAAVRHAEIDSTIFDAQGITIFLLTNQAIANNPGTGTGTNRFPGGYWYHHPVNDVKPDKWSFYDKEQVKQFILNHVMTYAMSYDEIIRMTKGAKTFFPTMATNDYGYISLHMLNSSELGRDKADNATNIYVNDFPSHYMKDNPTTSGFGMYITPRIHNMQTSNGSYIHVMDYYLDFPTDEDFLIVPVYRK